MAPLLNPQLGCEALAAAVKLMDGLMVADTDEVQPPADVTVTV